MKPWLYLDDMRTPKDERFHVVRSFDQFTNYIRENGIPEYISFDHDLSLEHVEHYFENDGAIESKDYDKFEERTGYHAACWLVDYAITTGQKIWNVGVHSHNPVGAKNIQDRINSGKKEMGDVPDCFMHKPEFVVNK